MMIWVVTLFTSEQLWTACDILGQEYELMINKIKHDHVDFQFEVLRTIMFKHVYSEIHNKIIPSKSLFKSVAKETELF